MKIEKIFPYNPTVEEQLKKIKLALCLRMNGEVSENMERKGVSYKLNYGTLLPEIKALAQKFPPNKLLAERLWHLRIRETAILATYLYPVDEFAFETAQEWVKMFPTQEITEICCFNLFSKLPYADRLIADWIQQPEGFCKLSAWLLIARKYQSLSSEETDNYITVAVNSITNENIAIQNAMIIALKKIGSLGEPSILLEKLSAWKNAENTNVFYKEIENELNFAD